jgi:hypothetical protein
MPKHYMINWELTRPEILSYRSACGEDTLKSKRLQPTVTYNTQRMLEDMAERGLMPIDMASLTGMGLSTVTGFLKGERQTAKSAKKIAAAMGYSPKRYVIRTEDKVVA